MSCRALVMPLDALSERLGVRRRYPELWEYCKAVEDVVKCYAALADAAERGLYGLLTRAIMYGVPPGELLGKLGRSYEELERFLEKKASKETLVI